MSHGVSLRNTLASVTRVRPPGDERKLEGAVQFTNKTIKIPRAPRSPVGKSPRPIEEKSHTLLTPTRVAYCTALSFNLVHFPWRSVTPGRHAWASSFPQVYEPGKSTRFIARYNTDTHTPPNHHGIATPLRKQNNNAPSLGTLHSRRPGQPRIILRGAFGGVRRRKKSINNISLIVDGGSDQE